jgi:hypothetical protein
MQTIHPTEHYTDRGDFAVMTRTTVVTDAQAASIVGPRCRKPEDHVSSTDPFGIDNCRITRTMLGWTFSLAPLRIGAGLNY